MRIYQIDISREVASKQEKEYLLNNVKTFRLVYLTLFQIEKLELMQLQANGNDHFINVFFLNGGLIFNLSLVIVNEMTIAK